MNKLSAGLFSAALLMGALTTGCEDDNIYNVDAPDWLAGKVDSIATANKVDPNADSVKINISVMEVGNKDCSSGWNAAHSQAFAVPSDKKLTLNFINHTSGASNWNNWNLGVSDKNETDADKVAFFTLRADRWALAGKTEDKNYVFDAALLDAQYPMAGADIDWDTFRAKMEGADVTIEVDHSVSGVVFIKATMVATDGTVMIETAQSNVPAADLYVFLITDASWFNVKSAVLTASEVKEVADVMPSAIAVDKTPKTIEVGTEATKDAVIGGGVFTVTYADGTTSEVDTASVTVTVPDLSTVGDKMVLVSYNTSKKGNPTTPVMTYYTIKVTNPIVAIEATASPIYFMDFEGLAALERKFDVSSALKVVATYGDGSTAVLENGEFTVDQTIDSKIGTYKVKVSYSATISVDVDVEVKAATVKEANLTGEVGAPDKTTGWWTAFSPDVEAKVGEATHFVFTDYVGDANYKTWCLVLRGAAEYGVVRADNYCWGSVNGVNWNLADLVANKPADFMNSGTQGDWAVWLAAMEGAQCDVYVVNNGNNHADVIAKMVGNDGNTYYQYYLNFPVNSADLYGALVVDGSYIKF